MPEKIYVSDADAQSATDIEILRMSRHLVDDLTSKMPGKKKKAIRTIREHGAIRPAPTISMLLRFLEHSDPRISGLAEALVEELSGAPEGEKALIECLFSSHHVVSQNAADLLERRGLDGLNVREIYSSSESLFARSKSMDIYTGDIKELFLDAINLYKSKSVEQASESFIIARDLLKDRVDWNENLRSYITDVLRLSPQLARSGVPMDNIQESLKTVTNAMKSRDYRETRDLVEAKKMEAAIGSELSSLYSFISRRLKGARIDPKGEISSDDRWIFDGMKKLAEEVRTSVNKQKRVDALESIYSFVAQEFAGRYAENAVRRIDAGDAKAAVGAGNAMLGMTKIVSLVLPNAASELYEKSLKKLVGKDDLDDAPWPAPLSEVAR